MVDVYQQVGHRVGTSEALALARELRVWHDRMVSHQRTLARLGSSPNICVDGDECAHGVARELWKQARSVFGDHAETLSFLSRCASEASEVRRA